MAEKYIPKPGSFSLFKNDKDGNEARPDYTGTGKDLDDKDIRVSAWLKDGAKGKFLSCRIEYPREKKAEAYQGKAPTVAELEMDIPF